MAWTALTYAYGSVLTSAKMTQNQDNFTAIANGDSGTPKIQTAALDDGCVTPDKIVNYTAGTTYTLAHSLATAQTIATSWTTLKEAICGCNGTVNIYFTMTISGGGNHYARIFVNDVATGVTRTASGNYSESISVSPGDEVQIKAYQSGSSVPVSISNFRIRSALPPFAIFNMQIE